MAFYKVELKALRRRLLQALQLGEKITLWQVYKRFKDGTINELIRDAGPYPCTITEDDLDDLCTELFTLWEHNRDTFDEKDNGYCILIKLIDKVIRTNSIEGSRPKATPFTASFQ